jgi:hypothetical protein
MDLVEYVGQLQTQFGELELRVAALEKVFIAAKNVNLPSDPSRPQAVIVDGPVALATPPVVMA